MKKTYVLPADEYSKIYSEINTNYVKYKGKFICAHESYDIKGQACVYHFENFGYNNYNIFLRSKR